MEVIMLKPLFFTLAVTLFSIPSFAADIIPSVSKGSIERVSPFNSQFVKSRYLDIWLPPGYSNEKNYDVLYMHDGRMLFDAQTTWNKQEWMVDEVAGSLIEQNKVRPFIVVAIPNAGKNRHSEFFPQQPFQYLSAAQQSAMYKIERAPDTLLFNSQVYSDNYLKFIVKEVVPYIEEHYSVNIGAAHRYLAGSSMGGLISWYGLMQYPNEFAGAICMSTHWPGTFAEDKAVFQSFLTYIDKNLPLLSSHKLYFDHGDQTLDAMYPVLQQKLDKLMQQHQYPSSQWRSLAFPGENHSEASWSKRLSIPLEFIFAR